MANPEQLAILKEGVEVWNKWYTRNSNLKPDLSGADLRAIDLRAAFLMKADLSNTDMRGVNLYGSNMVNANLRESNLGGAILRGAALDRADLHAANLGDVDLRAAYLSEANLVDAFVGGVLFNSAFLDGADFSNSRMGWTDFGNVDLSQVKGLHRTLHEGPSTIGIDTIYKSAGKIPEEFLKGAGVPERFISFARSLVHSPIEYYSVFISHSHKDEIFVKRLHSALQENQIRTWYFPEDAKWGETVWGEIDRGVKHHDKLVLVCSENSLQSGPVLRELERALNREDKEGTSVLFPIRIDDYIFDEWEHERKADVLRKVVGDFSGWETNAGKYTATFERLLNGLQADA